MQHIICYSKQVVLIDKNVKFQKIKIFQNNLNLSPQFCQSASHTKTFHSRILFIFTFQESISTVAQFLQINSSTDLVHNITSDLDFASTFFSPLTFTGTIEGNNHKLSNIVVNAFENVSNTFYFGIFGRICTPISIQNILLKNISLIIAVQQYPLTTQIVSSLLIAEGGGSFTNVQIQQAQIMIYNNQYITVFGPLIGHAVGNKTVVQSAFANCILNLSHFQYQPVQVAAFGGLVGFSNSALEINASETVFTFNSDDITQRNHISGMVARSVADVSIQLSTVFLQLYAPSLNFSLVGGFLAYSNSSTEIENCKSIIKGIMNSSSQIGTLIGKATSATLSKTVSDDQISATIVPSISSFSCTSCFTSQSNSNGFTVVSNPITASQYSGLDFTTTWAVVQDGVINTTSQTAYLNIGYSEVCKDNQSLVNAKCYFTGCITESLTNQVCGSNATMCSASRCCDPTTEYNVQMNCFYTECVLDGQVCGGRPDLCTAKGCPKNYTGIIIGSSVGLLLFLSGVVFTFWFLKRRCKKIQEDKKKREQKKKDDGETVENGEKSDIPQLDDDENEMGKFGNESGIIHDSNDQLSRGQSRNQLEKDGQKDDDNKDKADPIIKQTLQNVIGLPDQKQLMGKMGRDGDNIPVLGDQNIGGKYGNEQDAKKDNKKSKKKSNDDAKEREKYGDGQGSPDDKQEGGPTKHKLKKKAGSNKMGKYEQSPELNFNIIQDDAQQKPYENPSKDKHKDEPDAMGKFENETKQQEGHENLNQGENSPDQKPKQRNNKTTTNDTANEMGKMDGEPKPTKRSKSKLKNQKPQFEIQLTNDNPQEMQKYGRDEGGAEPIADDPLNDMLQQLAGKGKKKHGDEAGDMKKYNNEEGKVDDANAEANDKLGNKGKKDQKNKHNDDGSAMKKYNNENNEQTAEESKEETADPKNTNKSNIKKQKHQDESAAMKKYRNENSNGEQSSSPSDSPKDQPNHPKKPRAKHTDYAAAMQKYGNEDEQPDDASPSHEGSSSPVKQKKVKIQKRTNDEANAMQKYQNEQNDSDFEQLDPDISPANPLQKQKKKVKKTNDIANEMGKYMRERQSSDLGRKSEEDDVLSPPEIVQDIPKVDENGVQILSLEEQQLHKLKYEREKQMVDNDENGEKKPKKKKKAREKSEGNTAGTREVPTTIIQENIKKMMKMDVEVQKVRRPQGLTPIKPGKKRRNVEDV